MMPSIQRPLSGDVMLLHLDEETQHARETATMDKHGRSARTLLKDGTMRVTLVVLAPGGELAQHVAEGPITLQPIEGAITFTTDDVAYEVHTGELLSARAGLRHAVSSQHGAAFLLTVSLA
jgi:quercetin dioxygenase-like cupin family protein